MLGLVYMSFTTLQSVERKLLSMEAIINSESFKPNKSLSPSESEENITVVPSPEPPEEVEIV
jgi:hypothetical protein